MSDATTATGTQEASRQTDASRNAGLDRMKHQLRSNPLVALMLVGALFITVVVALLMWASAPEYRVLFSNLNDADGGRIINELETRGIPYRFSEGGQALLVPGNEVHGLRLQLAEQGLPRGGNVGFELLDGQAFGISQFAEQVNFQRGLEGELSRSMESLGPVSRARLHLAMAQPSVFVRDREPAKASVILTLHPGRTLGDGQVNAIIHLVSSSVPELAAEDVTVVDQEGRLLSPQSSASGLSLDVTQLDYVDEVERSYQRRIESILVPILGRHNVRAQVTAQVDFSQREETSERFGPNQPPNEAAVRSRQGSLSYNGGDDVALGIPGALSNTPPGAAPSPIELPEDDEEAQAALEAINNLRQDGVTNYEVDRNVSHVLHQRGKVERLSAAVVVNYRDATDDEGTTTREPLSSDEIAQIERLVQQAMGFSTQRGDAVEVVNSPFTAVDEGLEPLEWWQDPWIRELASNLGRYLLVALAVLLLYMLILRPFIKRYTQKAEPQPGSEQGVQVRVGDEETPSTTADGEDVAEPAYERPRKRHKSSTYEHNLSDLRVMAQEDPRMVALIVRNWMKKND